MASSADAVEGGMTVANEAIMIINHAAK